MKAKKATSPRVAIYVGSSIIAAVANALTFKHLLNKFKSRPVRGDTGHDYEFFVNQINVAIYVFMCLAIVSVKAISIGPERWWRKQRIPIGKVRKCFVCIHLEVAPVTSPLCHVLIVRRHGPPGRGERPPEHDRGV